MNMKFCAWSPAFMFSFLFFLILFNHECSCYIYCSFEFTVANNSRNFTSHANTQLSKRENSHVNRSSVVRGKKNGSPSTLWQHMFGWVVQFSMNKIQSVLPLLTTLLSNSDPWFNAMLHIGICNCERCFFRDVVRFCKCTMANGNFATAIKLT